MTQQDTAWLRRALLPMAAAALCAACADSAPPASMSPADTATGAAAGNVSVMPLPTAGANQPQAGAGIVGPGAAAAGNGAMAAQGGVPCNVAKIISDNCALCHSSPVKYGAPMSLMTLADFHANTKLTQGMKVFEAIAPRINATEVSLRMPPASSPALSAADLATLNEWLSGGADAGTDACAITQPSSSGSMGAGGRGAPPVMEDLDNRASVDPIEYDDPEMKCYKFLAHAQGDLTKPYQKTPGQDYINFTFKAPWTGTRYSRAVKLVLDDNSKVIHHWLLYKTDAVTTETVLPGSGAHAPNVVLLHGWAPGASPVYLGSNLGMKLDADSGFLLEAHYSNNTGDTSPDMSGAELCVTTKVPVHEVAMAWVGTDLIAGTSATGTCTPRSNEPIHIIAAQPHMHLKGNHMKVTVNRTNGMKDTIHNMPFDFEYQRYYVTDVTLMPGDTLTTDCTYSAPSTFGRNTEQEMCYFFSVHWPAGALSSASLLPVHGDNTCLL